jgi:hypothetical protein
VMYAKRGYIPDSRGLFQQGKHLQYGETVVIDDYLVLYFTKSVSR